MLQPQSSIPSGIRVGWFWPHRMKPTCRERWTICCPARSLRNSLLPGKKPEARSQKPEARSQKPEARSQKPEARSQKPEARSHNRRIPILASGFLGFWLPLPSHFHVGKPRLQQPGQPRDGQTQHEIDCGCEQADADVVVVGGGELAIHFRQLDHRNYGHE